MKFQCALLFFVAAFLAVSSEETNAIEADYGLKSVADELQQDSELPYQEYQLVSEKPASEMANVENKDSQGPEPYRRICLAVRCVPKWSPWKLCWCIRWSK